MHHDLTPAVISAVAFCATLAGHYIGDQWVQTCGQAAKKALDGDETVRSAMWHCAKHATTWAATVATFIGVAWWWLSLPIRPGWFAAGMAVNLVTHFVLDLRTPLIWLAKHTGRIGYIDFCQVERPSGTQRTGPGTGLFHLDQAAHLGIAFVASLVVAGPFWVWVV